MKPKSKRKRGQSRTEVAFFTPLTVEECVAHLKAGRPDNPRAAIQVRIDGSQFRVEPYTYKYPYRSIYHCRDNIPVWIEGQFVETKAALQVRATVMHQRLDLLRPIMVALIIVFMLAGGAVKRGTPLLFWEAFGLFMLMALVLFSVLYRRKCNQVAAQLLEWVEDRLAVRREKRW